MKGGRGPQGHAAVSATGSLSAAGARGGGGGLPEWSWRRRAVDSALEALYYSAIYVYIGAGEQEVQWRW